MDFQKFCAPKLDDCSHVFLRVDKVSPSLSQPYTGPHEVLSRNDKHITININGKKSCVSLDRVKPAFVFKDLPDTIPDPIINAESSHRHPVTTNMQTTKSGRRHIPTWLSQGNNRQQNKFNYIIAHLPPEAATIIRDVIMIPDPVEPYEKARTELIKEAVNHPIKKLEINHRRRTPEIDVPANYCAS
ncbi:integrase catalytic domain-containing protein [Trichonephila clavipes]|nr:integrase catalytic domain-containing protein [Trichonephila clavipes]